MAETPAATVETTAAPPTKKHRLLRGLLIGVFALAAGTVVVDDLALRIENSLLVDAVVEQTQTVLDLQAENQALKEALGIETPDGNGSDVMPVLPRQDTPRLIQASQPAHPSI